MRATKTDSKSKDGITVGLIDSIITIAAVLSKRGDLHDQDSASVREAMKDLKSDNNVSWLLTGQSAEEWSESRRMVSIAVDGLKRMKEPNPPPPASPQ
jgi:hypothetical protein